MLSEQDFPSKHLHRYFQSQQQGDRKKQPPIPVDFEKLLSANQKEAYDALCMMGWTLEFVRRNQVDNPVFVFRNDKSGDFACIESNGDVTINPDINIRV